MSLKNEILTYNSQITIVVVTKSVNLQEIEEILKFGHLDFGENRVQTSIVKWKKIKTLFNGINLHFIGKVQSNKVEDIVNLFSYVHSLESQNLAQKFLKAEKKLNKNINYFIQINTGFEFSLQYWSYLTKKYRSFNPEKFIKKVPHISLVNGRQNIAYLKKRYLA